MVYAIEKPPGESMNPLQQLHNFGQSIWFDYIRRNMFVSGELKRLITEDGIRGVTSNPAIFEKAIAGSTDYQDAIKAFSGRDDVDDKAIFESLEAADIQQAADTLRSIYDASDRRDGYISMEVSPRLAHDAEATLAEARRLWAMVDRPNLMVKVPATVEGIPVIETLLSEGINVNVTLLFSKDMYEQVAEAFISGLETRVKNGGDISAIASVASFFISRIDSLVDNLIRLPCWKASRARSLLPMPVSVINPTSSCSVVTAGKPWPTRAQVPSVCYGPARAPRTRPTVTPYI
jgi:transaldolase